MNKGKQTLENDRPIYLHNLSGLWMSYVSLRLYLRSVPFLSRISRHGIDSCSSSGFVNGNPHNGTFLLRYDSALNSLSVVRRQYNLVSGEERSVETPPGGWLGAEPGFSGLQVDALSADLNPRKLVTHCNYSPGSQKIFVNLPLLLHGYPRDSELHIDATAGRRGMMENSRLNWDVVTMTFV